MKVIVYAAGIASRLGAAAEGGLKGLVRIGDKALIEYQLDWIAALKPEKIVIVLGLQHEKLREFVGDSHRGIPVGYAYNPDYRTKGNMLSFWAARDECDSDVLFTTSDLFCARENLVPFLRSSSADKILVDQDHRRIDEDDPVKVRIREGRIMSVLKKLPHGSGDGIAIGVYRFSRESISRLLGIIQGYLDRGDDDRSLYYPVNDLVQERDVAAVFGVAAPWFDVDTPEELDQARAVYSRSPEVFQRSLFL